MTLQDIFAFMTENTPELPVSQYLKFRETILGETTDKARDELYHIIGDGYVTLNPGYGLQLNPELTAQEIMNISVTPDKPKVSPSDFIEYGVQAKRFTYEQSRTWFFSLVDNHEIVLNANYNVTIP